MAKGSSSSSKKTLAKKARARAEYNKEHYTNLFLRVEQKEAIRKGAYGRGLPMTQFIDMLLKAYGDSARHPTKEPETNATLNADLVTICLEAVQSNPKLAPIAQRLLTR